jgi:DNA-directed RNA polymerase subunit RPC12/RpoP
MEDIWMKTNLKQKEKSPTIVKLAPVPEYITCPKCGNEVELWTDSDLTICFLCGYRIFEKENIIH